MIYNFKEYIKENNKTDIDNDEQFDLSLHIDDIEKEFIDISNFFNLTINFNMIERPTNIYIIFMIKNICFIYIIQMVLNIFI